MMDPILHDAIPIWHQPENRDFALTILVSKMQMLHPKIFVDGSKQVDAVLVVARRRPPSSSVFTAELTAASDALSAADILPDYFL